MLKSYFQGSFLIQKSAEYPLTKLLTDVGLKAQTPAIAGVLTFSLVEGRVFLSNLYLKELDAINNLKYINI